LHFAKQPPLFFLNPILHPPHPFQTMKCFVAAIATAAVTVVSAMPAPDHPTPAPSYQEYAPVAPVYTYEYAVKDDYSGNDFGQQESRNDASASGSYFVNLPDGRIQKVAYTVDGYGGYQAEVTYVGEAAYPPAPAPYKPAPVPAYKPAPVQYKPAPAPAYKPAPVQYKPAPTPAYKPAPAFKPAQSRTVYSYRPVAPATAEKAAPSPAPAAATKEATPAPAPVAKVAPAESA